jgi:peptide/nickel transport system permease protein
MMQQAQSFITRGAWWMWVFPSLFIILIILCINLLGDGLRDAFDPRQKRVPSARKMNRAALADARTKEAGSGGADQ